MAKSMKLNEMALGYTAAALSAVCMFLLGIGWNLGYYTSAAIAMSNWHIFFGPSIGGIVAGMIEAGFLSFIGAYSFAWFYNKLA